jgi:hypothetical protein
MTIVALLGLMSTAQADDNEVPSIESVTRDVNSWPGRQIDIEAVVTKFDSSKHKIVLRWRRNFEDEQETEMFRDSSNGKQMHYKGTIGSYWQEKDGDMIRWFVKVQDKPSNNKQLARHPNVKNEKDDRKDDSPRYEDCC